MEIILKDQIVSENRKTFRCQITAIFPEESIRPEYFGIAQIEGEEIVIYIEFDGDESSPEYRTKLQLFDRESNDFYLKVITSTTLYTCFHCYCITPFDYTIIENDGKCTNLKTPIYGSSLLEIHCNSWIEDVLCEDVSEKVWQAIQMEYSFLENWSNLNDNHEFHINDHVRLIVKNGTTKTIKLFSPIEKNEKIVRLFLQSDQKESLEDFQMLAFNFFLFIRFATNIDIPSGDLILYDSAERLPSSKGCKFHYHPAFTSEQKEYPSVTNIPISLQDLIIYPRCIEKWYKCCETYRSSLSLLVRCFTKKYFINQRIIFLVQVFDSLQGAYANTAIVDSERFSEWKETVLKNASETAERLEIEDLHVVSRLQGMVSCLNSNSLKNRLASFIDVHFQTDERIKELGEKDRILKILMKLRNGASHGNSNIPDSIDGRILYLLWDLMKDIDRKLIANYILQIS